MMDTLNQTALELVQFTVDPADEQRMLQARAAAMATVATACPGFLSARLFRGQEPGSWIEVCFWSSLADAESAASTVPTLPEAVAYFDFITEPPTMTHATLVASNVAS